MVELLVPVGAGQQVTFDTIPMLRNQLNQVVYIKDIQVFLVTTYAAGQKNQGVPGLPATELPKGVLVLYTNDILGVKMIPLAQLVHIDDGTNPFQQEIEGFDDLQGVDWDKSYVQFSSAPANTPYIIPFGVKYVKVKQSTTATA